jgi:drug/metabolite transporter (DMT)-like permease
LATTPIFTGLLAVCLMVLLIVTAVIVHGIANLIWNQNIKYIDASKASVLSNLEPFVAMFMGLVILYKPVIAVELLGSFFIVGGVVISTYQRKYSRTVSRNH